MPNVTLAFDELVKGWTSEFTFIPDSGLSLNNNYYTFYNGRLWRHNSENVDRNTFYGITGETVVKFVFNKIPTMVKNFKTLGFEGTGQWDATMETNIENGVVEDSWFVEKEGKRYSWIRGEDLTSSNNWNPDLKSSSVSGLGTCSGVGASQILFRGKVGQLAVGDAIFRVENSGLEPGVVGLVESIAPDKRSFIYTTNGLGGTTVPVVPVQGDFILYAKNSQDKSGIIGFYNIVTMTNSEVTAADLFSANSSVFISTK